jgi:hypothetical protein
MDTLRELQRWYISQCNGIWEHSFGVTIDNLDNPGWSVKIDLADTPLSGQNFSEVRLLEHETDWFECRVRDGKFEGLGGPLMLEEILKTFLAWAAENASTQRIQPNI